MRPLSEAEEAALQTIRDHGGSLMIYHVPDKNERDVFGNLVPGITVYKKLDKLGLVVICEPLVDDDGFEWTPAIELAEPKQEVRL